jgi:hypothetical protein
LKIINLGAKTLTIHSWLGAIAGALSLCGFIPYLLAIWQQKTRPNQATWLIWLVVGMMIAASYRAAGAESTMWVSISYVLGPLITSIFALKFGERYWTKLDWICLLGVGIGLILWGVYRSPLLTLGINVGIDFLGAVPTIRKSVRDPYSEDLLAWGLFSLGGIINLLAIDQWAWQIVLYPIYVVVATTTIWFFLWWGRKNQHRKTHLN